jgi:MFS family permease
MPDSGVRPSMRRFLLVALGQLVSITGSALTQFAVPLWIYLQTGSLARLGLMAVLGLVPGIVLAPLAGAIADRHDRRRIMLAGDAGAGLTQAVLLVLAVTGTLRVGHIYALLPLLSAALAFQRFAYASAVPQLVPKRYLGHANGVMQTAFGLAGFLAPLVAVGLLAAVGLTGILVFDVLSYGVAVLVTALVRFPATLGRRRREPVGTEIANGFRYALGQPGFRAMLLLFVLLNVFLSPLFLLLSPLVLGFAGLGAVSTVAVATGAGAVAGGLTMAAWGGPRRRRMAGVLLAALALAACCLVTGLRPAVPLVAAGALGMSFCLALVNGIYGTIIQTKVPQRFHGRVIAVNTMIAWSTLPLGFGVVGPYGSRLVGPLVAEHGPLAGSLGAVIGTGPGRGIAVLYVLFALAIAAVVGGSARTRALSRFDAEVPDAPPDDLVGLAELDRRAGPAGIARPGESEVDSQPAAAVGA